MKTFTIYFVVDMKNSTDEIWLDMNVGARNMSQVLTYAEAYIKEFNSGGVRNDIPEDWDRDVLRSAVRIKSVARIEESSVLDKIL